MAETEAVKQAIWLQELLNVVTEQSIEKFIIRIDNQSVISLTRNPVFHRKIKLIHSRFHFIRECVEKGQVDVEHVSSNEQNSDILTKALGRIKFNKMKDLTRIQYLAKKRFQA